MDWIKASITTSLTKEEKKPEKLPNFPICCPFLYHSLSECVGFKKVLCISGMVIYFVFCLMLVVNFVGAILALACGFSKAYATGTQYIAFLLVSGFFAAVIPFFAFFLQYWPRYMICSSKSSIKYLVYFVTEVICIVFMLVQAAGVHFIGGCGIFSGLSLYFTFTNPDGFNYFVLAYHEIVGGVWLILAVATVIQLIGSIKMFRDDNASLIDATNVVKGFFVKSAVGI